MPAMLFGDFVHKLRVKKELTLRDLNSMGLSATRWSAVERNALPPTQDELRTAKEIFELDVSQAKRFDALARAALNESSSYPQNKTESQLGEYLPRFARTAGNDKPSQEQLDAIIDLTKKNY
jgi:transcriptional regulator with XRE-family HTH domain